MSLKKNIVANYIGRVLATLIGLVCIPIYIKHLGVEAYGLIGIFNVMQAGLALFDMGMAPALSREMARFTGGIHDAQSIRNLLRSIEIVSLCTALVFSIGILTASNWLASNALHAGKEPTATVAQAFAIMGVVCALHLIESIYFSSILGLQRQVLLSVITSLMASLRGLGAVGILMWVSPTIGAFFIWQGILSVINVGLFAIVVYNSLGPGTYVGRFSLAALRGIWRFAGGILGITALSLLLTQVDKILLLKLMPLESFGYYTFAATVAAVLYKIIDPITTAIYPRMVELLTRNDQATLVSAYHQGAQVVSILIAPATAVLSFFPQGFVFMWSGDASLAENSAGILAPLALGGLLSCLMRIPYLCQVAHGWTSLTLRVNIVAVVVLIPALLWVVPRYGAIGAAWIWVALNAGYVLFDIQLMHHRLLREEKWHWYIADVLMPVTGAITVMLSALPFQPTSYSDRMQWFTFILTSYGLALAFAIAMADTVRLRLVSHAKTYVHAIWKPRISTINTGEMDDEPT